MDLDKLKFDERGLIPAIVVDAENKKVLTLAYMNRESLEISMREGRTCFWSRSRRELWRKGETSGNVQRIVSITADCDMDALVVKVAPELDLRGMETLEAIPVMERYIDSAVMGKLHTVTIIHGKGTGALRQAVQQALRKNKAVKSFRLGRYGEGETGVTVVELK